MLCFLYKFHIDAHGEGGGSQNKPAEIEDVRRGEVMHLTLSQMHKNYIKSVHPLNVPSFACLPFGKVKTTIHIFTGEKNSN